MEEEIPDRLEAFMALVLLWHYLKVVHPHFEVPLIALIEIKVVLGKIPKAFVDWVLI